MGDENVAGSEIGNGVGDAVDDGVGASDDDGVGGGVNDGDVDGATGSATSSTSVAPSLELESDTDIIRDGVRGIVNDLSLTVEDRVAYLETEVNALSNAMEIFKNRLVELIENQNASVSENNGRRDIVTAAQFENYCDCAIAAGHSLGVSRSFVKTYLEREFGMESSRYLDRRLGALLRRKVQSGDYKLENSLYSLIR